MPSFISAGGSLASGGWDERATGYEETSAIGDELDFAADIVLRLLTDGR